MNPLPTNISLYVGDLIGQESERVAIDQIIQTLRKTKTAAVIFANVNLSGRQIDIVLALEGQALLVEIKGHTHPLKGSENGDWEYRCISGNWRKTRNYYNQTLGAKNALQTAMGLYKEAGAIYPDADLVFIPSIPAGSSIPAGDFKVGIGGAERLMNFDRLNKKNGWPLSEWHGFAKKLQLNKIEILEAAFDKQLAEDARALEKYEKAFRENYEIQAQDMVDFPCAFEEQPTRSNEIAGLVNFKKDILICGPSGCGKSMLSIKFALNAFRLNRIPILIEAKYFNNDFGALLNREASLLEMSSVRSLISACNRLNRNFFLVIDGFNECSSALQERLLRCLKAIESRYSAGIVISTQLHTDILKQLSLSILQVPEPNKEVKEAISGITYGARDHELLLVVRSGLEARIVGHISKDLNQGSSRFVIFDTFIRERLKNMAQEGIRFLSCIGKQLSENIAFSLSVRDVDRLIEAEALSPSILNNLLRLGLLKHHNSRISYSHEMYLNVFIAESVIRSSGNNPDKILSALSSPRHKNHKALIIGAIDNVALLDRVLSEITDPQLILSCFLGECGLYGKKWAENLSVKTLQHMKNEAESIVFKVDEKSMWQISAVPESIFNFCKKERSFLSIFPDLLRRGKFLDEIYEIVRIMDETIQKAITQLRDEAIQKDVALRSGLYSIGLDNQNSPVAISHIIAFLDVYISDAGKQEDALNEWIVSKLNHDVLSNGQLLMLLKLGRVIWDKTPFASLLPDLIRVKYSRAPNCLRMALLDTAHNCGRVEDGQRHKIVDTLNEIETQNIWESTFIVDALKNLGGLEDTSYEGTVKIEIERVFDDPENPEMWSFARRIYSNQFDHPYDGVYWEVLHQLPASKRKIFLSLAVRSKDSFRMFTSCLISDLASYRDKETGKYIEHWTELPPEKDSCPQDSMGVFVVSHIVLGKLGHPIPAKDYIGSNKDNALLACGEIYYWANRNDFSLKDRMSMCCTAWEILQKHELGLSLSTIKECEESLNMGISETLKKDLGDLLTFSDFPERFTDICRQALIFKEGQLTRREWDNTYEVLQYGINAIGYWGEVTDLVLLRQFADDPYCGDVAIRAIGMLEERISSDFKN